jgi:translation initiation factor 1 (eIF-1/SUI1)
MDFWNLKAEGLKEEKMCKNLREQLGIGGAAAKCTISVQGFPPYVFFFN